MPLIWLKGEKILSHNLIHMLDLNIFTFLTPQGYVNIFLLHTIVSQLWVLFHHNHLFNTSFKKLVLKLMVRTITQLDLCLTIFYSGCIHNCITLYNNNLCQKVKTLEERMSKMLLKLITELIT